MENLSELIPQIEGKRVLFITTKNTDYIRITQEIAFLSKVAGSLHLIGSKDRSYAKRLVHVYKELAGLDMDDIDIVFVGFAPQLVIPFFRRKFTGKLLIEDFFISVYDTMVLDRQKFKDGGLASKLCRKIDEKTLVPADYIVCDTKAHGAFFASELGADSARLRVCYLHADETIYYKRPVDKTDDKSRVLYFGSILNLQGVDVILAALKYFKDRPDYSFEIIGPIPKKMNAPVQSNVTYIDWLSQEDLAEHIAYTDLCLAGHFSGTIMKARRTIPGKAYIYEAMGKAFILGDGEANHELFEPDSRHIFVKMGDPKALADAILNYFER